MKQKSEREYVAPLNIALAYGDYGALDQAFAWLDKAFDDHSEFLLWMNWDPSFDSMRADPRFAELEKKFRAQVR